MDKMGRIDSRTFSSSDEKESKGDLKSVFPKKSLINKTLISWLVVLTTVTVWFLILFSIRQSFEDKRQIMTLYYDDKYTVFQTHVVSIYIILVCKLSIILLFLYNFLFYREDGFINLILDVVGPVYVIMMLLSTAPYLFGLFHDRGIYSVTVNAVFNMVCTGLGFYIYLKIKRKSHFSTITFFSLYVYISILMSSYAYMTLSGVVDAITFDPKTLHERTSIKEDLSVAGNVLYCLMSVMLITYYKDVYFTIVQFTVEAGYLSTHKRLSYKELITGIIVTCFSFGAVIFTWKKNKNIIYGKDDTTELIQSLEMNHRNQEEESN